MGKIKAVFIEYSSKWSSPDSIQNNHNEFITETTELFRALYRRIGREDQVLFTMLENVLDAAA